MTYKTKPRRKLNRSYKRSFKKIKRKSNRKSNRKSVRKFKKSNRRSRRTSKKRSKRNSRKNFKRRSNRQLKGGDFSSALDNLSNFQTKRYKAKTESLASNLLGNKAQANLNKLSTLGQREQQATELLKKQLVQSGGVPGQTLMDTQTGNTATTTLSQLENTKAMEKAIKRMADSETRSSKHQRFQATMDNIRAQQAANDLLGSL